MNGYAINVQGLSKSFHGKPAVREFSLRVPTGRIFGFLGPNGSGKTTTIRMLCGLLTPDSGSGTTLGYDIRTEAHAIKREVGYMTQKFSLYEDLTIRENLEFIGRMYALKNLKQRVSEALEELGLQDHSAQLVGTLSGGWKQRLALATCLLHSPKLLLLDEPTAGVDPAARRDFWDHIHALAAQGITVLVSTHYMDEAERCHALGYIARGKLLVEGSVDQVIKQYGLTTFVIGGAEPTALARELRGKPGVEMAVPFGATLHVSGTDSRLLEQSLAPYAAQRISPGLEDVFIQVINRAEKD
ncbi:MAG: ABC transporter ATP-binding protein [Gammaproteobacteria bacterium]|nr:ABC transporter ATP-binding protein [Gammaproteobacteria bacterium]